VTPPPPPPPPPPPTHPPSQKKNKKKKKGGGFFFFVGGGGGGGVGGFSSDVNNYGAYLMVLRPVRQRVNRGLGFRCQRILFCKKTTDLAPNYY